MFTCHVTKKVDAYLVLTALSESGERTDTRYAQRNHCNFEGESMYIDEILAKRAANVAHLTVEVSTNVYNECVFRLKQSNGVYN